MQTGSNPDLGTTPACYDSDPVAREELQALFGSTNPHDHGIARMICDDCPVRAGCLQLAEEVAVRGRWAGAPEGTWGGVLWVKGKPKRRGMKRASA